MADRIRPVPLLPQLGARSEAAHPGQGVLTTVGGEVSLRQFQPDSNAGGYSQDSPAVTILCFSSPWSQGQQTDDPPAHDAIGLEKLDHAMENQTHPHGGHEEPDDPRRGVNALRADLGQNPPRIDQ